MKNWRNLSEDKESKIINYQWNIYVLMRRLQINTPQMELSEIEAHQCLQKTTHTHTRVRARTHPDL